MKSTSKWLFVSAILASTMATQQVQAQSELYPHLFNLEEVTLNESVFKTAMELNNKTLLEYDVDRLLTPFMRQAGFSDWEKEHPNFSNWGSGNFRLDGHVGGHYLSALSLAYAASKDEAMRTKLKERLDYMVDKMEQCQAVFDNNTEGLYGYIGGYPDNSIWTGLYKADLTAFNTSRGSVPIYTMHKVFAGLRDAWLYGDNEKAKTCFLKLCDWGVNLIAKLTTDQMQDVLNTEHGGINEVFADAYNMTGKEEYIKAAHRYSHTMMIKNMQTVNSEFLNNKHANTQVPKYIGFARIAQEDKSNLESYRVAAENFWTEVVEHRTVAIGGNSISEHFLPKARSSEYITNPDGPESCNTNNMLKLSEDLFGNEHKAKYADFYEQAMLNHILATQNPTTGGYVYFTSLRPQHYHIYSQVNQGMWCCVGTGMENHSKYGEFVYAHNVTNDTLFVNLFMASTLSNEKFALEQSTKYPFEQSTTLTIQKDGNYALSIRHPKWCTEGFAIKTNGETQGITSTAGSYASVKRAWKKGDVVEVALPMKLRLEACPDYTSYVAICYGPVLLGAKTGTDNMTYQFAGEGRMDHAPSIGSTKKLTTAPMLIGDRDKVLDMIKPTDASKLQFKIDATLYNNEKWADLVLEPYFGIHESRYMIYWNQVSEEEWKKVEEEIKAEEDAAQRLIDRSIDFVATGEQQSDAGHVLTGQFGKGSYSGEFYVDCQSGQSYSYTLSTSGLTHGVSLMCRYHSADRNRVWTIYVDDKELVNVTIPTKSFQDFYNEEYLIPDEMLKNAQGKAKTEIKVTFKATGTTPAPGLYYLRLLKDYNFPKPYAFVAKRWIVGDAARVDKVEYNESENTIKVWGKQGTNNIAPQYDLAYNDSSFVRSSQKYFVVKGKPLKTGSGMSYLWWLAGANHGTQVVPILEKTNDKGETVIVWDVTTSGLNDYLKADSVNFSSNGKALNTIFGLTSSSSDGSATLSDICFYSQEELYNKYPEIEHAITSIDVINASTSTDGDETIYSLDGKNCGKSMNKQPNGYFIKNGEIQVVKH